MAILNYTTKVSAIKTIGEIMECLAAHQARKISTDYDSEGNPIGLSFMVELDQFPVYFQLPCNWEGVLESLKKAPKVPRSQETKEQALRVSWRILKDWVEAQMAIVEARLATTAQVFLPYAVTKSGQTVFEKIASGDRQFLLS